MKYISQSNIIPVLLFLLLVNGCSIFKSTPSIPKPDMTFIEGGTFLMGDIIYNTNNDAIPVHEVTLDDFYIGTYEISYAEYDEFARATNRPLPDDDHFGRGNRAVARVNWYDARAYCQYWGWRLPSETEWEYAARARGESYLYSGTNQRDSLRTYAVSNSENYRFSQPIGSRKSNKIGLFDMTGNVYEWIGRYYQFYENPNELHDLENSSVRIIRGGSFKEGMAIYRRVGVLADVRDYDIGFRCAVSADEFKN